MLCLEIAKNMEAGNLKININVHVKITTLPYFTTRQKEQIRPPHPIIRNELNPIRGPDDQTHSSQSETSYSMTSKLRDF